MSLRIFNVLLGTWLFLSAFAWPHSPVLWVATLLCGGFTVISALIAIYVPRVRYLTALAAFALFVVSMTSISHLDRTVWHNGIVAIAIFVAALVDRTPSTAGDQLSQGMGAR